MKERPAIGLFKGVKEMPVLAAVAVPHPPLIIPEVGKGEEKESSTPSMPTNRLCGF